MLPAGLAGSQPAGNAPELAEPGRWEWWQWLAALALLVLVVEGLAVHALALRRAAATLAGWRDRLALGRGKEAA
jgi:hypothetical protein